MLKDYLSNSIFEALNFKPTSDQKELINSLSEFIFEGNDDSVFILKGYAGTGKTTVISALVNALKKHEIKTQLLAPTGRAAKVISKYSSQKAFTIHKIIYRQKSSTDGFGVFSVDYNKFFDTIFIVDEASMIGNGSHDGTIFGSGSLLDDLMSYVYNSNNCKLILVGDIAQLPPVGLEISPALNKQDIEVAYYKEVHESSLKEVVRQSADSGILYNATLLRLVMANGIDCFPKFELNSYIDIVRISGADLIDEISTSYSHYGEDETIIVCRSNSRANKFNMGIRNSILYREEELSVGDMLMIVKNNYYWSAETENMDFIANGDTACVRRIRGIVELYGFRFAKLTVEFLDFNEELDVVVLLDTLTSESPSLSYNDSVKLYREIEKDYLDIRNKKKRFEKIRENEYFNALQIKFAYAVTCHKAQGGQWCSVFVDQGWIPTEVPDIEYMRWLYTAFTRATEKLYLVNFNNEFFSEE